MAYLGNPLSTMDFPVDYFTGDGTSTTFQLSYTPASATSILVHIGGVKQVASTTDPAYYLDGSKLVFVSPPGAYSPIEVNYLGIAGQVNIPGTQSVTQDMLSLQLANTFVYQTTANGATASFTLNAPPVSANSLVVSANGVVQYDYSVNGTNLTFGFTPPVGTFIRITSLALAQAGVPSDGSVTSVKLGANLTITGNTTFDGFSGAGARIRGDFNNTTIANRVAFQTSSANQGTILSVIPNGSSQTAGLNFETDSSVTTGATLQAVIIGGSDARIASNIRGAGTYLPLTMYTGGSERMRIGTTGHVGVATGSGSSAASEQFTVQGFAGFGDRATTNPFILVGNTGSGAGVIGTYSNHAVEFRTNNTERMRITSSGSVGIYNTGPSSNNLLTVGNINGVTRSNIVAIQGSSTVDNYGNCIEFGHSNSAGYRSTLGAWVGTGAPFLGFHCEGGTTGNTFRTRGIAGSLISTDNAGAMTFNRVTNSNADNQTAVESMRIDSSGDLLIGLTGGSSKLMVSDTNAVTHINNGNSDVNGSSPWLATFNSATAASATFGWAFYDSNSDGSLHLYRRSGTTTGDLVMRIARNTGIITTPSQPMFVANGNQNNYVSVANGALVPLNTVKINTSSSYNTSTYTFTAPVAGRYLFIVAFYFAANAGLVLFDFQYNSGTYQRMYLNIPANDTSFFGQCIMNMAAGDTARIINNSGSSKSVFIGTDLHTGFSGYLIG